MTLFFFLPDGRGVKLNVSARVALMERLQRPSGSIFPPLPTTQQTVKASPPPTEKPKVDPSPCIHLTNMFDPAT